MAFLTANGLQANGEVIQPRVGPWRAYLRLTNGEAEDVTGAVTIEMGGRTMIGTSCDVGKSKGAQVSVSVCAGAGGMTETVSTRSYRTSTVREIVTDILSDAGETLSATADTATLDSVKPRWALLVGSASDALTRLLDSVGAVWRFADDGTVWLGPETWPTVEPEHVVVEETPEDATMAIATESGTVAPGTTFAGQHVERATYNVDDGTRVFIEFESERRAKSIMDRLLKRAAEPTRYHRALRAQVISQNSDGTLELKLIEGDVPNMKSVSYRAGIPGVEVTVPSGQRATLVFEDGSPERPVVVSWDASQTPTDMVLNVGNWLYLGSSTGAGRLALAELVLRELNKISLAIAGAGGTYDAPLTEADIGTEKTRAA
ncbi:MAG: hypothetical protein ACPGWS_09655 [Solirubrobacterales bacterium]